MLGNTSRFPSTSSWAESREIIKETFKIGDGYMIVPDTLGIGVELNDEAVLAKYPFRRKKKIPIRRSEKTGFTYAGKEGEIR